MAAHLACGPDAAWSHHTAAFVWGLIHSPPRQLELLVPRDFAVRPPRGARVRRCRDLDARVDQLWWPWVTTAEDTILDLAEVVDVDEIFALLGRAFQRHRTTERLLAILSRGAVTPPATRTCCGRCSGTSPVAPRAPWSCATSAMSKERTDCRTASDNTSAIREAAERHDVAYAEQRVLVELDGELGHEGRGARIRDGRRDRRGAAAGWLTARAFWPDVVGACALAGEVGAILRTRGWAGQPHTCRRRPCLIGAAPGSAR